MQVRERMPDRGTPLKIGSKAPQQGTCHGVGWVVGRAAHPARCPPRPHRRSAAAAGGGAAHVWRQPRRVCDADSAG